MNIYLLVIKDRHCDLEVQPFFNGDKAVSKAKELAKEFCARKEDLEESYPPKGSNTLYHCFYSCEGDSVSVITSEFQDSPPFNINWSDF